MSRLLHRLLPHAGLVRGGEIVRRIGSGQRAECATGCRIPLATQLQGLLAAGATRRATSRRPHSVCRSASRAFESVSRFDRARCSACLLPRGGGLEGASDFLSFVVIFAFVFDMYSTCIRSCIRTYSNHVFESLPCVFMLYSLSYSHCIHSRIHAVFMLYSCWDEYTWEHLLCDEE